jgi:hypothetical protein
VNGASFGVLDGGLEPENMKLQRFGTIGYDDKKSSPQATIAVTPYDQLKDGILYLI